MYPDGVDIDLFTSDPGRTFPVAQSQHWQFEARGPGEVEVELCGAGGDCWEVTLRPTWGKVRVSVTWAGTVIAERPRSEGDGFDWSYCNAGGQEKLVCLPRAYFTEKVYY